MKKIIMAAIIASTLVSINACASDTDNKSNNHYTANNTTSKQPANPSGNIYRSDGFRPGLSSEWIQIQFNNDMSVVIAVWYWNTKSENKTQLKIVKQEGIEGEISGIVGTLQFPEGNDLYKFGIIEDRFNLSYDEMFQEFEYEGAE